MQYTAKTPASISTEECRNEQVVMSLPIVYVNYDKNYLVTTNI